MKQWLFRPFVYIAGVRSLLIGLAVMLVTAVICYFSKTHFDGIIDVHTGRAAAMPVYFAEAAIDWGIPAVLLYISGLIFSTSSIRLIDVAGTLALARWVMILPAIMGFAIHVPAVAPVTVDDVVKSITPVIIIMGLLCLAISVWMIVLMYHAFATSCNLKGGKAAGVFTVALILSELLSSYIIHQFVVV